MEDIIQLPKELAFTSKNKKASLIIKNNSNQSVVFKIRSNDKKSLEIKISEGYIDPFTEKNINANLTTPPTAFKKLKLEISWAIISQLEKQEEKKLSDITDSTKIKKKHVQIAYQELKQPKQLPERIQLTTSIIQNPVSSNIGQTVKSELQQSINRNLTNSYLSFQESERIEKTQKFQIFDNFEKFEKNQQRKDSKQENLNVQLINTQLKKQQLEKKLNKLQKQLKEKPKAIIEEKIETVSTNTQSYFVLGATIITFIVAYFLKQLINQYEY